MKAVLRFLAAFPAAVATYVIVKLLQTATAFPFLPTLIGDLTTYRDFHGHFIMGPLFVSYRELVPSFLMIVVAHRIAPPRFKKAGMIVIATGWAVLNLIGLATLHRAPKLPIGFELRTHLESGSQALGIVIAFLYHRTSHR